MMAVAPSARMVATASTSRDARPSRPNSGAARAALPPRRRATDSEAESNSPAIMDALPAYVFQLRDRIGVLAAKAGPGRHETLFELLDFGGRHDAVVAALRHHPVDQLAILGHRLLPLPGDDFLQHLADRRALRLRQPVQPL